MVEIFEVIGSNRATMVEILLRHSGPILSTQFCNLERNCYFVNFSTKGSHCTPIT